MMYQIKLEIAPLKKPINHNFNNANAQKQLVKYAKPKKREKRFTMK